MFDFLRRRWSTARQMSGRKEQPEDGENASLEAERKYLQNGEISVPIVEVVPRDTQQLFRGAKRRFSEVLDYNLSLLAERMKDDDLVFKEYTIGSRSRKRVVMAYLQDLANEDIVAEVKERIKSVRTESLLDAVYLERNLEDSNLSPFPQIENTTRPDVAESALLQGRVIIFTEAGPEALIVPTVFADLIDTPEDAYTRWFGAASFFRIARYIMFIMAASLPGFYIALTSFNIELLPTRLAFLIAGSREGSPFPVYFDAFLMMGVVEGVRMVLIRVPSQLGSAIAIFSGIVLVGAGITSGIFGGPIVIVVTLTVITSFAIPGYDLRSTVRLIQFFTMLMTAFLGIFGFAVTFFFIFIHLATLKSFGIPYMAPIAPIEGSALGHTVLRENSVRMPKDETYQPSIEDDNNPEGEKDE